MASNYIFKKVELQDDEQADVLYSPFRSKSLNPRSWTSKMNFWQQYLKEVALDKKMLIFDIDKLPNVFERKGIIPKCLPTVLEELQRSGDIKSLEDYKKSNGWLSWGFTVLVKQPVTWGLGRIIGSPKKQTSLFVWTHVLKRVSEEVLELHHENCHPGFTSSLISYPRLKDICSSLVFSDDEFSLVLTYLEGEKKLQLMSTERNGVLVKICDKGKKTVMPVTAVDTQIFEILEGQQRLEKEAEVYSSKIDECTKQAQFFVKTGRKPKALHCLRRRKLAGKALERRYALLSNLEEILHKIDDAQTNEMVVNACESGASAIKNLNKELSVDKVEAVMDNVQEALKDSEEIEDAMSSGSGTQSTSEIDAQAEEELENLLKEMSPEYRSRDPKNKDLVLPDLSSLSLNSPDDLPDVPTHTPSTASNWSPNSRKDKPQDDSQLSS